MIDLSIIIVNWNSTAFILKCVESVYANTHEAKFEILVVDNASPDGDIGESHDPESHLIPRACFAALGRGPALEIYGNDYPTPDKTAIRDYIHVSDLAAATGREGE